jgi:hypothetical protein
MTSPFDDTRDNIVALSRELRERFLAFAFRRARLVGFSAAVGRLF